MEEYWMFEEVKVVGRRCTVYGAPYTAIATITITNGEASVEGLITSTTFSKKDVLAIEKKIKAMGYNYYITSTFINNLRVSKRVEIN